MILSRAGKEKRKGISSPDNKKFKRQHRIAKSVLRKSRYYDEAREFARLVSAECQINDRTRAIINEYGLRDDVLFGSDRDSSLIQEFGILKEDPEEVEIGVPHPTTYILDRSGIVRFVDVREDFHIWLDPERITRELAGMP